MIGKEFLCKTDPDGSRTKGKILSCMDNYAEALTKDLEQLRFTAQISGKDVEELVKYNDMCGFVEDTGKNEDGSWNYTRILKHRHKSTGKGKRKKKKYEVLLEWVNTSSPNTQKIMTIPMGLSTRVLSFDVSIYYIARDTTIIQ